MQLSNSASVVAAAPASAHRWPINKLAPPNEANWMNFRRLVLVWFMFVAYNSAPPALHLRPAHDGDEFAGHVIRLALPVCLDRGQVFGIRAVTRRIVEPGFDGLQVLFEHGLDDG